jgi:hypothetical protein
MNTGKGLDDRRLFPHVETGEPGIVGRDRTRGDQALDRTSMSSFTLAVPPSSDEPRAASTL